MTLYLAMTIFIEFIKVLRSISKTTMINRCTGEIVTEDYALGEGRDKDDDSCKVFFKMSC